MDKGYAGGPHIMVDSRGQRRTHRSLEEFSIESYNSSETRRLYGAYAVSFGVPMMMLTQV